jgi:hypothetical protein
MGTEKEHKREVAAGRVFNLRREKARADFKGRKPPVTAGKPMQGPWYYLYLHPKWVLRTMTFHSDSDTTMDHVVYWRTLATEVAAFYKCDGTRLKDLAYAMPRGRVQHMQKIGGRREWVAYHGNDFQYDSTKRIEIVSAFGLNAQHYAGLVRFVPDDHEIALAAETEAFKQIVGLKGKSGIAKVKPLAMENDYES